MENSTLNSKFTTKERFEGRIRKAKAGGLKAVTKQSCEILQKGGRVLCLLSSRECFFIRDCELISFWLGCYSGHLVGG